MSLNNIFSNKKYVCENIQCEMGVFDDRMKILFDQHLYDLNTENDPSEFESSIGESCYGLVPSCGCSVVSKFVFV